MVGPFDADLFTYRSMATDVYGPPTVSDKENY